MSTTRLIGWHFAQGLKSLSNDWRNMTEHAGHGVRVRHLQKPAVMLLTARACRGRKIFML